MPSHENRDPQVPGFDGCGNFPGLVDIDGERTVDPTKIRLEILENPGQMVLETQVQDFYLMLRQAPGDGLQS